MKINRTSAVILLISLAIFRLDNATGFLVEDNDGIYEKTEYYETDLEEFYIDEESLSYQYPPAPNSSITDLEYYDEYGPIPEVRFGEDHARALTSTIDIGMFLPLSCNSELDSAPCDTNVSNAIGSIDLVPLTIPCGECWTLDSGAIDANNTVTFHHGINVIGKLVIPENSNVTIYTTFVVVQGELKITMSHPVVTPDYGAVRFILTGSSDESFVPADSNIDVCGENAECNIGKKAFIVAGGKLNIDAFPSSCEAHTPILDKVIEDPFHNPEDFYLDRNLPIECPIHGSNFLFDDFSDGGVGNWTGRQDTITFNDNGTLRVTNRISRWNGPYLALMDRMPHLCLQPDRDYIFSARIKLDMANGTDGGKPSWCARGIPSSNWNDPRAHCPRLITYRKNSNSSAVHSYVEKLRMNRFYASNYGEWSDFVGTIRFTSDELNSSNEILSLYIEDVETGVDITLDFIQISLPPVEAPSVEELCTELVLNGDAELGINPYPFTSLDSPYPPVVTEDLSGNKFFSLTNRTSRYSSIRVSVNTNCFDLGVIYTASAKFRFTSDVPYDFEINLLIKDPDDNMKGHGRTIAKCNGQNFSDGWKICSGDFYVDPLLAKTPTAEWRIMLYEDDAPLNNIDFDDISIKYKTGQMTKVVVSSNEASCWGIGSKVHIPSSSLYLWPTWHQHTVAPNGITTIVEDISMLQNGLVEITIRDAPFIPVISRLDNHSLGAELVLLSRNVKIQGDNDEADKGGYVQILHSSNAQRIIGVEFSKMGRMAEQDRFPLQFLFCGSVLGSIVSMNSFHDNHQRCVTIDGTSDLILDGNVAYNNFGHCMHIGSRGKSQRNTISRNLVSQTKSVPYRVQWADDRYPAAFSCFHQPNNLIDNIAVSSQFHGFELYLPYREMLEDGTEMEPEEIRDENNTLVEVRYSRPRENTIGSFSGNVACSNGDSGFWFRDSTSFDQNVLSYLQSFKNRYYGVRFWSVFRMILKNCEIGENGVNVHLGWSDEIGIQDTTISGITSFTRNLLSPPYFSKPCSSLYPDSVGLKIMTAIWWWDRWLMKYVNQDNRILKVSEQVENIGATLKNVHFSDFDFCPESYPVEFNTDNIRDGHWDYASSFNNVTVAGERLMNAAKARTKVSDIIITDIDGLSNPANLSSERATGSFVSDLPYLTKFLQNCSSYSEGIAYCPNACLRTVSIYTDPYDSKNLELIVTQNSDNVEVNRSGIFQYEDDIQRLSYHGNQRRFVSSLPNGTFTLKFVQDGELKWPRFAIESWEQNPSCDTCVSPMNVTILEPSVIEGECENLILNGNMDQGVKYWNHDLRGSDRGVLIDLPTLGSNGSSAIAITNRTDWSKIGQYLDTRCFRSNPESIYEVRVSFRLEKDGVQYFCDRFDTGDFRCPKLNLKSTSYASFDKEHNQDYYVTIANTLVPNDTSFNRMHGTFRVNENLSSTQRMWLYTEWVHPSISTFILDSVSVRKRNAICHGNYVINGDFETGDSSFWNPHGYRTRYNIVDNYDDGKALEVFSKANKNDGPMSNLYIDMECIEFNDRLKFSGKFKMKDFSSSFIRCDPNKFDDLTECSVISFFSSGHLGNVYLEVAGVVASDAELYDNWTILSGILVLNDERYFDSNEMWIRLENSHPDIIVLYDDISIELIPVTCSELILNSDFENGTTAFWVPESRSDVLAEIVSPGADGSRYAGMFSHVKSNRNYKMEQYIDSRCLEDGLSFIITAEFKLVNKTDSSGMSCNPHDRNQYSGRACPYAGMYASGCNSGDGINAIFWNEIGGWDPNEFNAFSYEFKVSPELASCSSIRIRFLEQLSEGAALIVDNFRVSLKTTVPPTMYPTLSPTVKKTESPTPLKTAPPTSANVLSCPMDGTSKDVTGIEFIISRSSPNTLCTLTKVINTNGVEKVVPLGRSYSSYDWEVSAGDVAGEIFKSGEFPCYEIGCQVHLPKLKSGERYELTTFSHSLSEKDEIARLLETATYGITDEDIRLIKLLPSNNGVIGKIFSWVQDQMDSNIVPVSSHREFWRKGANPRLPKADIDGTPSHPCDKHSRWRNFAFDRNDYIWWRDSYITVEGHGPYILKVDGVFRTQTDTLYIVDDHSYIFDPTFQYRLCNDPQDFVGGNLYIEIEDGQCKKTQNPKVNVGSYEAVHVLNLTQYELERIDVYLNGEQYIIREALTVEECSSIPTVREWGDDNVYGKLDDDSWLMFDPRLQLDDNSLLNPLNDGGWIKSLTSGGLTQCANAPRSFLNEDSCVLSSNACRSTSNNGDFEILLNNETVTRLSSTTGRYVYTIHGLNVVDEIPNSSWRLEHPCTSGLRSRWELKNTTCQITTLMSATNESLSFLISQSSDSNPYIRDIYFPQNFLCDESDVNPNIELLVDDQCWVRVHPDKWSIYDMTFWVGSHPGGPYHIKKWFQNENNRYGGSSRLVFPNIHHEMSRWEANKHLFSFIGRFGDPLKIKDLPNILRTESFISYYDRDWTGTSNSHLVCGSPGEVSNDPLEGFKFETSSDFQTSTFGDDHRRNVWLMLALSAKDQLRQRIAWAFSQLLVVVPSTIIRDTQFSEFFLNYNDIFIRHAFGNYRNILREISYSPLMAENLSFRGSKSSAYVFETSRVKVQADENFAREIMQLFSMGTVQLQMNGLPKLDEEGKELLAYTNDDIMSFARAWTGFDLQRTRGNIDDIFGNRLDPMKIEPMWRDRFPKSDTTNQYIGDFFYPLCEDLPSRPHLMKGAKYRFLAGSRIPELMYEPINMASLESFETLVLGVNSTLRNILCNRDGTGTCNFQNNVRLSDTIAECFGLECSIDSPRVVQVDSDAFYEFVRPPCVSHAFYNEAAKISDRDRKYTMCANSLLPVAAEACCSFGDISAYRQGSLFTEERMTQSSAEARCSAEGKYLCDFARVNGDWRFNQMYFWTNKECKVQVKIDSNGMGAVVHNAINTPQITLHVNAENENWFKLMWENGKYPSPKNNCDGVCELISDGSCLCGTRSVMSRVFASDPESSADALNRLYIGAVDPRARIDISFTSSYNAVTGITTHLINNTYNTDTVFEFYDDKGRLYFLANKASNVQIRDANGSYTGFSFRNTPHFMNFIPAETALRDAQYESEAVIDHYFYHDNTAPFLSKRLIQRLVNSNPSPRYIKAVSTAFKEGFYEANGKKFGKGKYGDLAATFAAIYLDREARSILLDKDPVQGQLREPILKITSLLRGMQFHSEFPVTELSTSVGQNIGQVPYGFESVFSFFLPEFQPYGRIGDASLVSPEGTLLDMPKVIGIVNGLLSITRYGLSQCDGGFGEYWCHSRYYGQNVYGRIDYNKTSLEENFQFETFEGPSLSGGFDSQWIGRTNYSILDNPWSRSVRFVKFVDSKGNQNNHVLEPPNNWWAGFAYSPKIYSMGNTTVVKFEYFASLSNGETHAGGAIGYVGNEQVDLVEHQNWLLNDLPGDQNAIMSAQNKWITCQVLIPSEINVFRIVLSDLRSSGRAYFDNIQIGIGTETTCTGVVLDQRSPPGNVGKSAVIVDELATLLTAGRLTSSSRSLIRKAYDEAAGGPNDKLRIAQQLILTSSEFHTTDISEQNSSARDDVAFPTSTGKPYRAIVYIMLSGGSDSFNMLAPYSCSKGKDLYQEYQDVRKQVAMTKATLLPIESGTEQVCETFGVHYELPVVRDLYNQGDLLFFANTGVMSKPVDKTNYNSLTNVQLFAHNHMQQESKRVDPYDHADGTGILGRISDVLTKLGHNVGSFSIDRFSVALVGKAGVTDAPMIVGRNGIQESKMGEIADIFSLLHNKTDSKSGFFAESWSSTLMESLTINRLLREELENVTTSTTFPEDNYLASQLKTVTRLMATRKERGVDTDTFYVEMGGFDTHATVEENLSNLFPSLNDALNSFTNELVAMDLWDNVTAIQVSDFARTLEPNSGDGTDHAWGGNYMMFGGKVKGGRILGKYPSELKEGPFVLSRGRIIPTLPWDAVFLGIADWMGVPSSAFQDVCPNIANFNSSYIINSSDMFDFPTEMPSVAPTYSPTPQFYRTCRQRKLSKNRKLCLKKSGCRWVSGVHWTQRCQPITPAPTAQPSSSPTSLPSSSPTVVLRTFAKADLVVTCPFNNTKVEETLSSGLITDLQTNELSFDVYVTILSDVSCTGADRRLESLNVEALIDSTVTIIGDSSSYSPSLLVDAVTNVKGDTFTVTNTELIESPSAAPSASPSSSPTLKPSELPSNVPTTSYAPSSSPTPQSYLVCRKRQLNKQKKLCIRTSGCRWVLGVHWTKRCQPIA